MLITIGRFSKVLKGDGMLLFKPFFRDTDFVLDLKTLYHAEFKTLFHIRSIYSTARGFNLTLKEVHNEREASFLVGEEFAVPKRAIEGKSKDLLIGLDLALKDGTTVGKVLGFTKTPEYHLLIVLVENEEYFIPFIPEVVSVEKERIVLLREEMLAN